jgi:hypothetical protein
MDLLQCMAAGSPQPVDFVEALRSHQVSADRHNECVDGKPRQSVVATLGRVDNLAQDGCSGARFAHSAVVPTT